MECKDVGHTTAKNLLKFVDREMPMMIGNKEIHVLYINIIVLMFCRFWIRFKSRHIGAGNSFFVMSQRKK